MVAPNSWSREIVNESVTDSSDRSAIDTLGDRETKRKSGRVRVRSNFLEGHHGGGQVDSKLTEVRPAT